MVLDKPDTYFQRNARESQGGGIYHYDSLFYFLLPEVFFQFSLSENVQLVL